MNIYDIVLIIKDMIHLNKLKIVQLHLDQMLMMNIDRQYHFDLILLFYFIVLLINN
jgi:hypothetical protein